MQAVLSWFVAVTTALTLMRHSSSAENKPEAANTPEASVYTAVKVVSGGAVAGTITYSGKAMAPKKLAVTKDTQVCGKVEHVDESLLVGANGGIKNAVVSIKGIKSGKGLETLGTSFVLDQKGCMYTPHVSVVPVNATLKIVNPDGILHNIHTYSQKNPPFNKSQPQFKKEMTTSFAQAELVAAKCDVHGWMSASILVVGWRSMNLATGSEAKYITNIATTTAAIITSKCSAMPTAVMIESIEKTKSITAIWRMAETMLSATGLAPPSSSSPSIS